MFPIDKQLVPWLIVIVGIAAASAVYLWSRHIQRTRAAELRDRGYRLIRALTEYSAWIDYHRDVPFTASSPDELASPEPLTQARDIMRESFPEISQHMVRLLQAHSHVVGHLWQQNLLRLSQGSEWQPAYSDKMYQQLRGAQEDVIDDMIALCRELIGDAHEPWRRTGSDFAFASTSAFTSEPGHAGRG